MSAEFKDIAQRIVNAENRFQEMLAERAGVPRDVAAKMHRWMAKKKLTKLDLGIGQISVKHGMYLDLDVLARIAEHVKSA
jgi:hypothetical protein